MTREEYKEKLMAMIDDRLDELEPELYDRIMSESGPDCYNKTRRITENIFFWTWKNKGWRHEQMRRFGMNPNGRGSQ